MPASPFMLQSCHRTKPDGSRQDGWQVVQMLPGQKDPEPLHEPWYGVYSKQLAAAFLDGVLLLWFIQLRKQPPKTPLPEKRPHGQRVQELQFT